MSSESQYLPENPPNLQVNAITVENLLAESKLAPSSEETLIILQRNARDNRSPDSPEYGALEPNSESETRENATIFFNNLLDSLSPDDQKNVVILVMAGDNTLITPEGKSSPHKRAVETGVLILEGATQSITSHSLDIAQIFNYSEGSNGKPLETSDLKDLKVLEDTPEFVDYLNNKCQATGKNFWEVYEADSEKEMRIQMGAEGPKEIAQRVAGFVSLQSEIAKEYHATHPNKRLIIWGIGAYDSLSPYIKENIIETDTTNKYLKIENGGGVAIRIKQNGESITSINGNNYSIKP